MSKDIKSVQDIKTQALVLRRTNYGEADRILNLITPMGKCAVIAKGVRRSKSKLAGAVEMFTLSDVVVHLGRGELGTLTGAKMSKFYGGVLKDYERLEQATLVLKLVNRAAEELPRNGEFFAITRQALSGLNAGCDIGVVMAWFLLNLARACGEQINLYRDGAGEPLVQGARYEWSGAEEALVLKTNGAVDTDMIKVMRLMISGPLVLTLRVKRVEQMAQEILKIAQAVNRI